MITSIGTIHLHLCRCQIQPHLIREQRDLIFGPFSLTTSRQLATTPAPQGPPTHTMSLPLQDQELAGKVRKSSIAHDSSLSYSACVPIQNQTIPSGLSTPRAR